MTAVVDLTAAQQRRTGNVRVLVVDDTPALRMLMRVVLEDSGFEVVGEAGDGLTAISMTAELHPDLVLLDLAMPVMDGLEALPRLRREAPAAKVVIVSGFERRAMERQVLDAGADAYVEKGLAPDEFISVLRGLFAHTQVEIEDVTAEPPDLLRSLSTELTETTVLVKGLAAHLHERISTDEERQLCAEVTQVVDRLQDLVEDLVARAPAGGTFVH